MRDLVVVLDLVQLLLAVRVVLEEVGEGGLGRLLSLLGTSPRLVGELLKKLIVGLEPTRVRVRLPPSKRGSQP